ncbi:BT4734/BF3469 family protein [Aquimarina pacifica]|uniref:BT4734/BF3469 family protein n=1 Tax=Aquimarina pacifica TaxID=1296415 RepID=UPI0004B226B3|nr:BT4734/BF3469 family protein [Aquimarina pacifica]
MITRKDIIAKTHYGLKIYSYVLREFNPNQVLKVDLNGDKQIVNPSSVNRCKLIVNPFLQWEEASLSIVIENRIAVYKDLMDTSFYGDPFDFAQLYFKEDSEYELLKRINEVLHLTIASKPSEYEQNNQHVTTLLDTIPDHRIIPKFSYFHRNLFNLYPNESLDIPKTYEMIRHPIRKYKTEKLRSLGAAQQKIFKRQNFDYVTFSGTFTKRANNSLIKHSNLLTVDIDDVQDQSRLEEIKEILLHDPYFPTELLFVSPRGNGLKWVVEISLKEVSHGDYFTAISKYLKQTYTIEIDTHGEDVARACLLPYDPNAYIHPKYT